MGATFPYITPNIHLPGSPDMEIMDAGLADNFGLSDALKYMHVFREWIEENTSGVVIISIRDKEKNPEIKPSKNNSFFSKLSNPISGLYNNWDLIQDYNYDQIFEVVSGEFSVPVDLVLFEYVPKEKNELPASLSWHLTKGEKESIKNNIWSEKNQNAVERIVRLISNEN